MSRRTSAPTALSAVRFFLGVPIRIMKENGPGREARSVPSAMLKGYPFTLTNCSMNSTRVFTLSTVTAL
jgi:hypothetical protein